MNNSKYKCVVWDWNGTLLDDAWLCVEIMNGILERRNLPPLTHDRYQEVFDFPVIGYYRQLGFDFDNERFQIPSAEFIVEYEKRWHETRLQPNADKTLKAVADLGVTQVLLCTYKQNTLEELSTYADVRPFFSRVIGLDDHYAHGLVVTGRKWAGELGYGPHEVLFVGDTVHDFRMAGVIGADCILIPSGHHTQEKLEICGVLVLRSLPDVPTFLRVVE